ncbi:MAG: bacterial Ig-like domain-containing protein [Lachnospiraceae bacterium]|nr:bacterial Ig-like domain-containing protein [Lachnospiraceae bacterium]
MAQTSDTYLDAFRFDPEKIIYDGMGDLDLLEGVSLEGYTVDELKDIVFIKVYKGDTLSEKIVQYTAETETGKVRSTRPLTLYRYEGPEIHVPKELPTVTRDLANHFGDLLAAESEYYVDDGFGNDVHEHAEISYKRDATKSAVLNYTISFENMFGDKVSENVDVTLTGVPAYLELTEPEVILKKGESFDLSRYVARAEFADGGDASYAILYNGSVDASKVGTYEVEYELEGEKLTLTVRVIE